MKKYNKPTVEVVELSVRESLSALPSGFKSFRTSVGSGSVKGYKNVTIYSTTSVPASNA